MKTIAELMNLCQKELKMCMRCRVINRTTQVIHSRTREEKVKEVLESMDEVEDSVEVTDILSSTIVEKIDTTHETVPTLPQPISIAILMTMLLKNVLFYKLSARKRDHRWEIRMYS